MTTVPLPRLLCSSTLGINGLDFIPSLELGVCLSATGMPGLIWICMPCLLVGTGFCLDMARTDVLSSSWYQGSHLATKPSFNMHIAHSADGNSALTRHSKCSSQGDCCTLDSLTLAVSPGSEYGWLLLSCLGFSPGCLPDLDFELVSYTIWTLVCSTSSELWYSLVSYCNNPRSLIHLVFWFWLAAFGKICEQQSHLSLTNDEFPWRHSHARIGSFIEP